MSIKSLLSRLCSHLPRILEMKASRNLHFLRSGYISSGRGTVGPSRPLIQAMEADNRSMSAVHNIRSALVHGYVGDRTPLAGEYHSHDFPWESCIPEGKAAIECQVKEHRDCIACMKDDRTSSSGARNHVIADQGEWEAFHQRHSAARFFKEKRYIPLEFPVLVERKPLHVAEIGCGCGSALLPVLKANKESRATACDLSPAAIELFKVAAEKEGISSERINAFAYDASSESRIAEDDTLSVPQAMQRMKVDVSGPLAGLEADALLMIFTLSAVLPKDMPTMLRNAASALRVGGLLLFRDYGLYDMAQQRFKGSQLIDPDALVYRRQDGTLAHFFALEEIEALAEEASFDVVECDYTTTLLRNRKDTSTMKRVFVHAVLRKRDRR